MMYTFRQVLWLDDDEDEDEDDHDNDHMHRYHKLYHGTLQTSDTRVRSLVSLLMACGCCYQSTDNLISHNQPTVIRDIVLTNQFF